MPWKRREVIGDCELILGDCLEVLPTLGLVDAVVTSPPYDEQRAYTDAFMGVDCLAVLSALSGLLSEGGVIVWNVADGTKDGSETGSSFRQALHCKALGLRIHDTMIFEKYQAFGGSSRAYLHAFEFMFVFSNGTPKTFNAIMDKPNARPGRLESTARGGTRKDGTIPERKMRLTPDVSKRTNVWRYAVGGGDTGHPAVMPLNMASDHVYSWTNTQDVVLDPFMGSGTTGVACVKLGRKFIGVEIDEGYFEIACRRIRDAYAQPDMLVEAARKPEQLAMLP